MTLKLVDAYEHATGITVVVDLDASNPDPAEGDRLLTLEWGSYAASKIGTETKAQYLQRLRAETRGLALIEAARRGFAAPARTPIPALVGAELK